jgi:hypothetical protein
MKTYKITNNSNLLGKRDPKYNSIVNVEYVDNRIKKNKILKAGESATLTVQTLPLAIHRLRIKKLVEITEVDVIPIPEPVKLESKILVKSKPITEQIPVYDEHDENIKKITQKKKTTNE